MLERKQQTRYFSFLLAFPKHLALTFVKYDARHQLFRFHQFLTRSVLANKTVNISQIYVLYWDSLQYKTTNVYLQRGVLRAVEKSSHVTSATMMHLFVIFQEKEQMMVQYNFTLRQWKKNWKKQKHPRRSVPQATSPMKKGKFKIRRTMVSM